MNARIRLCPLCLIWLLMSGCAATTQSPDQMIAAAKDVDQKVSAAFNRGDVDAMMENYWNSPDLIVYPPDVLEVKGWAAVKEELKMVLAHPVKFELIDPHYFVAGEYVIDYGQWKITEPGPNNAPAEMVGRYTTVLANKNGKWVIVIDHPSVPLPPMGPPPGGTPAK